MLWLFFVMLALEYDGDLWNGVWILFTAWFAVRVVQGWRLGFVTVGLVGELRGGLGFIGGVGWWSITVCHAGKPHSFKSGAKGIER